MYNMLNKCIKTEVDYILLVFNCVKYSYKSEHQKKTWLKKIPSNITYFHVIGDPELEFEYTINNTNKLITIKVGDDYNSLPEKVVKAYSVINDLFTYKYIFKTDDDQQLCSRSPTFFYDITTHLNDPLIDKIHYGGGVVDVTNDDHLSQYYLIHPELPSNCLIKKTIYCSGRFYLLSKEAVDNIVGHMNEFKEQFFEDYFVGFILDSYYKENIWRIPTHEHFIDQKWPASR